MNNIFKWKHYSNMILYVVCEINTSNHFKYWLGLLHKIRQKY